MKPFLTPDEAQEIKRVFAIECERKLLRSVALNDALIPLTIAPPKPKYRVGQYVVANNGTPLQITEVVETGGKTLYRTRDGCSWSGDVLRPLTAAEIEGPKEEA